MPISKERYTVTALTINSKDAVTATSSGLVRGMRYFILISTVLCLASIMANIQTYNFTVICIEREYDDMVSEYSNEVC
ncbi:unnamed protein product [Gongylonema pulchrum]|uniref:Col_cuticle_N domain-containing protein n=1 Tax=Gongylonema pulchrum TaxID=637853 RepID=A0A183EVT8_9BILA|nr:unnamed protein product [Gongylonema pulchrum]